MLLHKENTKITCRNSMPCTHATPSNAPPPNQKENSLVPLSLISTHGTCTCIIRNLLPFEMGRKVADAIGILEGFFSPVGVGLGVRRIQIDYLKPIKTTTQFCAHSKPLRLQRDDRCSFLRGVLGLST